MSAQFGISRIKESQASASWIRFSLSFKSFSVEGFTFTCLPVIDVAEVTLIG
jgi:hypothetical protein